MAYNKVKYLFFDTESANCRTNGNIFSFGYMIADENFNVSVAPTDIVINPHCRFDGYVKKHILAYKSAQIKSAPSFGDVYDDVCALMCDKNTICIGYGIENDVKFLNGDCLRYKKPQIVAEFYDVQKLIKQAFNRPFRKLSIEYQELAGESDEHAHRSDADAYFTMRVAQEICLTTKKSLATYISEVKLFDEQENERKKLRAAEKQRKYAEYLKNKELKNKPKFQTE